MTTLVESFRILRSFWPMALFATIAGGVSGLASAALLATVNRAVHTPGESVLSILAAFAGLCVVSLAGELLGNIGNNLVGQKIIAKLRKELSVKIVAAPIAEIERFQPHRLITILGHDVDTIGGFTFNFSMICHCLFDHGGLLRLPRNVISNYVRCCDGSRCPDVCGSDAGKQGRSRILLCGP